MRNFSNEKQIIGSRVNLYCSSLYRRCNSSNMNRRSAKDLDPPHPASIVWRDLGDLVEMDDACTTTFLQHNRIP